MNPDALPARRAELRIGYYPAHNAMNQYCTNFRECLGAFGRVEGFSFKRALLSPWRMLRPLDIVCINWLENGLLDARGHSSAWRRLKIWLKLGLLRLHARNVCFVRHNAYPHGTTPEERRNLESAVDRIEHACTVALTHSPTARTRGREYVPHPLYREASPVPLTAGTADQFVAFGAIARYKNLHGLMQAFPDEQRLLILGPCTDATYLEELERLRKPNIRIRAEFVPGEEVRAIIAASRGLILSHHDPSMVVSGSFFYGLSIGARILAVSTPFLDWAHESLGPGAVITFPSVRELTQGLNALPPFQGHDPATAQGIDGNFGDAAVIEHLAAAFRAHNIL